jgi:alpha,alpha-trehalase
MGKNLNKQDYIQLSGELCEQVQKEGVFADSKTFVDCIPKFPKKEISEKYHLQKLNPTFNIKNFVQEYFIVPSSDNEEILEVTERKNAKDALHAIWQILEREADAEVQEESTLIPLNHPYVVPGGRFREMYYWDSYFTSLGLFQSNKIELIENMCDNYVQLLDTVGCIPNGNRIYFTTRSQPPVFILTVDLLVKKVDARYIKKYIGACEKEYRYWMRGVELLDGHTIEHKHIVDLDENEILNRYYDEADTPREEAYAADTECATGLNEVEQKQLYKNIRAGAESGWDFSSRWFKDYTSMKTIRTTEIIPVDLNCLLYKYETILSDWHDKVGLHEVSVLYAKLAEKRKSLIQKYCYDKEKQFFVDYAWKDKKQTGALSLAAAFALFAHIATPEQARIIANHLEEDFLYPGGLVTTVQETGEQWDFPNGWAPLQWITIQGLYNYGLGMLAEEIKNRWVENCVRVYNETGRFFEKYNVVNTRNYAKDGEYPTQIGFGWTNGVLLDLMGS